MKRFSVFAGDYYYPSGGMDDFLDSFDELEVAKNYADNIKDCTNRKYDWYQIYDSERDYIVYE